MGYTYIWVMNKLLFIIIFTGFIGFGANAQQIDCSQMGMLVNVSDTDYVKLYHAGPYLLWPREHNKIYWEITDYNGTLIHQDTTTGNLAGHMGFSHNVSLNDSIIVSSLITHDSVSWGTDNPYSVACLIQDTLYWEPTEIIPGVFTYRWEFVGGSNIGVNVLSTRESEGEDFYTIIYPNPNTGLFSIQLEQEHIGSSYQILDNLGRLIDKGIIRELSQDFDYSNKPKGVYRIQVSNEKSVKTLNVVIQ